MILEYDIKELGYISKSIINKFNKGDFIEPNDAISMAYISMFEKGMKYDKKSFVNLIYNSILTCYRKTLAISSPITLDGTIYQKFSRTKICSCCKEELSINEYSLYYNAIYEGWYLSTQCKVCAVANTKKHNEKRPDLFKERMKRFNDKRNEKRKKEREELSDSYIIKRILKQGKLTIDWLKNHPEYIEKERFILKRKLLKKWKK